MKPLYKIFIFLAIILLARAISFSRPIHAYANIYYDLGVETLKRNDLNKAVKQFEKALFHDPKYHLAHYQLALIHSKAGNKTKSTEYFKKAVESGNSESDAIYTAAFDYLRTGELDKAIACFEKKNDRISNWHLAEIYFQRMDYEKAFKYYKAAVAWDMTNLQAQYKLGLVAIKLNNKAAALNQIDILMGGGVIHDEEKARILLSELKNISPVPALAKIHYKNGRRALERRDNQTAIKQFSKALFHDPKFEKAYYELGLIYQKEGLESKKLEYFRKAVEHGGEEADALYAVGVDYFKKGQWDKAIACFEKKNDVSSNWYLGEIYSQKNDYEKALYYYGKTLAWDHKHIEAHYKIGLLSIKLNKKAETLDQIDALKSLKAESKARDLESKLNKS